MRRRAGPTSISQLGKDNCQIKWHKVYFISRSIWPKHFASEICAMYFHLGAVAQVIEKHCSV